MNDTKIPEPNAASETLAAVEAAPAPETNPAPTKAKPARKPKGGEMSLAELAERYIKHLEDDGKSPGTCASYTAELRLAVKHLGGDTPIASITLAQVSEYFESKAVTKLRSGKKKSPLSTAKTLRVARQAFEFAVERKWLASAPLPAPAGEQA